MGTEKQGEYFSNLQTKVLYWDDVGHTPLALDYHVN